MMYITDRMSKKHSVTDIELINNVRSKNCSDSLVELSSRHAGLFYSIGQKMIPYCGMDYEDLNDNRHWVVYNAINSFNPQKGSKFSTWLANQVRYFCLNHKNRQNRLVPVEGETLEYLINRSRNDGEEAKTNCLSSITDLLDGISDDNAKKAIYYRYFHNQDRVMNYSEIAEILKVTPQTALNWHNKFIKYAKKKLTYAANSGRI